MSKERWAVTIQYMPDRKAEQQTLTVDMLFTSWPLAAAVIAATDPNTIKRFEVMRLPEEYSD